MAIVRITASRACALALALGCACAGTLAHAGGIAGTVTGTEAGAPPVAGATVFAYDINNPGNPVSTQGGNDGTYHVANLPAGTYLLRVDAAGRGGELYDNVPCTQASCDFGAATLLTLPDAATELVGKDFALDGIESLGIELRNADTGQRIAGQWKVLLPDNSVITPSASADAPTLISVPGGGDVRIAADSFQCGPASDEACLAERYPDDACMNLGCDLAAGTAITVPAGGSVSGLVLTLARGGRVSGHVYAGDAPSTPLLAGTVRLHRGDGSVAAETGLVVDDGSYAFAGLDGGPFFAIAQAPSGYLGQLYDGIDCALDACAPASGTALAPTPGNPVAGVDFLLPRGGAISGRLREETIDLPIPGAVIDVFDAQGNAVAQTNSTGSGQFLTPALPSGNYTLRASAGGHVTTLYPAVPCDGGACDPLGGDAIAVLPPQTTSLPDWRLPRLAGAPLQPALLYLNRCVGGCVVHRGNESAINNTSNIVGFNTNIIPAYAYGDASFAALAQCVRRVYAPYFVAVTEVDPGNVPHRELMIGGMPSNIGMSSGRLGVSPWACGAPINNAIAFVFADAHPDDTAELCWTATHEAGHLFGLDHEFNQPDTMSYLPITDQYKHFVDADMPCGEFSATPCYCGTASQQNTDSRLATQQGRERVFADGMGDDPWALPAAALAPFVPRADRAQACGTRTDRYTPAPAAWWIGGPAQIAVPSTRD